MGINVIQVVHGIQGRKHVPPPVPKTMRSHLNEFKCPALESKAQTPEQVAVHQESFLLLCRGLQQQCKVLTLGNVCQWAVRTHLETHHKLIPSGTAWEQGGHGWCSSRIPQVPHAAHCSNLTAEAMPFWSKSLSKVCLFQTSYQCREQMRRKEKQFKGVK